VFGFPLTTSIADSPYFHLHSVVELLLRCQLVFSIWNGCCRLTAELDVAVSSALVPSPSRSHPNSAIGVQTLSGSYLLSSLP
jgi:hypothetical protein